MAAPYFRRQEWADSAASSICRSTANEPEAFADFSSKIMAFRTSRKSPSVFWAISLASVRGTSSPAACMAYRATSAGDMGPKSKSPGKTGGLKRGDRSKRFLLFAYGELQQLKLLHLPVFFFLVPYVEPNFPFSYSYRAYKISSRPETRSCYFTNFFKMFRYLNSAFSF